VLSVLSIAGSDSSGGAGIQADIKTIAAHRLFAQSAITAITAQNTTGVFGVEELSPSFVAAQIDVVFEDIRPAAVKIGMVSSAAIIEAIAQRLLFWEAANIVLDPVMMSSSKAKLICEDAIDALKEYLFPLADIITPNLYEAAALCGFGIADSEAMEAAAFALAESVAAAVLIKGGHSFETGHDDAGGQGAADDFLVTQAREGLWLRGERIPTKDNHGTGCTLSSAIACNLALGFDMPASVARAKAFVSGALKNGIGLGRGSGPLNHMWEYGAS